MKYVRMGDLIERPVNKLINPGEIIGVENIAMDVFPQKSILDNIQSNYVQSKEISENENILKQLPPEIKNIGKYEALLYEKIQNPKHPIISIQGPMGCGKSTVKNYVALYLVLKRNHCNKNVKCKKTRLVAEIDFNQYATLNKEKIVDDVVDKFFEIINNELNARIESLIFSGSFSNEEQFIDFWNEEKIAYRNQKSNSKSFRNIINMESFKSINESDVDKKRLIDIRRELKKELRADGEAYFNFLLLLWKYIIKNHFNDCHGCSFIIFDNVDSLNPILQNRLVEIVHSNVLFDGPCFIFLVRPETYDFLGMATGLIDKIDHDGPDPYSVVITRLEDFCADKWRYYNDNRAISVNEYDIVFDHIYRVKEMLKHSGDLYKKFIHATCGQSVRSALLIASNMFYIPEKEMLNKKLTMNELIRYSITSGKTQFFSDHNNPIDNLFQVHGLIEINPFVKIRVLLCVLNKKGITENSGQIKKTRQISEVVNTLVRFGYTKRTILAAIDDLISPYHQLIRSNGFDSYLFQGKEKEYDGHEIKITAIGEEYLNYLLTDIRYFQGVILDALVDGEIFPGAIKYNNVNERFYVICRYLDELLEIEYKETSEFINGWNIEGYNTVFDLKLITLIIMQGISEAYFAILESEKETMTDFEYEKTRSDFESLILFAKHKNKEIFGVSVL